MRTRYLLAILCATAFTAPATALAQGTVGGAVVGGTVGVAIEAPPPPVVTYVEREDVPSVTVRERVVVGERLPDTVVLHPVPKYERYSYAVVNHRRVIVEPRSRKVIKIIER